MVNILVPIIEPGDVTLAVNEAIALNRQSPVLVHLLAVRRSLPVHITRFFGRADLQDFHREAGMQALAPAMRQLEAAGIPYEPHVEVGRQAQSIVKLARHLGNVQIVLPRSHEGLRSSLGMGSIGRQVEHLIQVQST